MQLGKLSLINLLMEDGEEDIAVRLALSSLPDVLDLVRDKDALVELGMPEDGLLEVLPAVAADPNRLSSLTTEDVVQMEQTISARWAGLVTDWTARS